MKTLQFNKKSWHYRLANLFFPHSQISNNFCGYFWNVVISGLCSLAVMVTVVLLAWSMFIAPFMYFIIDGLWFPIPDDKAYIGIGVTLDTGLVTAIIIGGIAIFFEKRKEKKRLSDYEYFERTGEYPPKNKPSFIVTAWSTFKDKVCYKVEFK